MSATYSLAEVADDMRLYEDMKDPVRWLTREIKLGRIQARKYGRSYRMTREQIEAAQATVTAPPVKIAAEPEPPRTLSAASMRRRTA